MDIFNKGGIVMATFFMFGKYSSEALKEISAERTEKAMEIFKKLGGEVKSMYALVGNYDLVFIVELPGIKQAIQASVALSEMSGISFTTAPAITVAEFDKLITK